MKKFAIAAAVTLAATGAVMAGSIEPPIIEIPPTVIVEEASASTGAGLVFLLMLAAVAAAAFAGL